MNPLRLHKDTIFSINSLLFGSAIRVEVFLKRKAVSRQACSKCGVRSKRPQKRENVGKGAAFALIPEAGHMGGPPAQNDFSGIPGNGGTTRDYGPFVMKQARDDHGKWNGGRVPEGGCPAGPDHLSWCDTLSRCFSKNSSAVICKKTTWVRLAKTWLLAARRLW